MAKIMMHGIDISNHQGKAKMDLDKVLTKHPEIKVVIIKSSEGTDFDDAYDEKYIDIALRVLILMMLMTRSSLTSLSSMVAKLVFIILPDLAVALG